MLDFNLIEYDEGMDEIEEISSKDIAVIGMSAHLPQASDLDEFWDNMRNGIDCVTEFPNSRRADADRYLRFKNMYVNDVKYRDGAYLEEIDKFDYKFFNISPKEAALMDPNQRLFLQTAWEAIEDSGYGSRKIEGSETGVYVGYVSGLEYKQFISEVEPSSSVASIPGNLTSVIAGRLSYILDLKGPSVMVDTACSSSLVAVHMACTGIRNGDCEMAIAGSVKLSFLPVQTGDKFGIESGDSRTRAFDDSSDGTGMGEGVIAILLKPLSKAVRDGDRVYGVIKGSAVNQDGRSIGLTAPNAVAQEKVILKAWKDAGINPETISYIETHGTGTKLGDPIEIDGITRAFRNYTQKNQFCAIGALKTNIGHLDNASGIAGLVRAILAMDNKEIPPILHFNKPNSKINFETSPVYINKELTPWETEGFARRCGVSAFGLSGTNCHVVLEEPPAIEYEQEIESEKIKVFTISAKSLDALRILIQKYLKLTEKWDKQKLEDICYTALTGRGHYEYRVAIVIRSKDDFKDKIRELSKMDIAKESGERFFYGQCHKLNNQIDASTNTMLIEFVEGSCVNEDLINEILKLYVKGANIQWEEMYRKESRKKAAIPVYPFEKRRCWIEIPEVSKETVVSVKQIEEEKSSTDIKLTGSENGEYTQTQILLGQIWGTVLGYKEIDINEDFYELGGDSIIAANIANRTAKQIDASLSVADILAFTTIQELSDYIDKELKKQISTPKISKFIEPVEEKDYYPASSAQKRLYVLGQLKGIETCYNMPGVMIIEGKLNKARFEDAFKTLVQRHETLKTSFQTVNCEIVQVVHKDTQFNVKYSELDDFTGTEEEIVRGLMHSFVKPFDLETAPLLRVEIVKIDENRHIMMFDMHHIISDGTSMAILVKEIIDLYDGRQLPELRIQYKDFADWQNRLLQSQEIKKQEEYWVKRFEGEIPLLQMPTDYSRPNAKSFEGDRYNFVLGEELTSAVNRLAKESGTTLYMVLMAAYNILLSKYSGQTDIIVGSPIAGRQNADLENIIGMFVNALPIRNLIEYDKSFIEFLYNVRDTSLRAYENQDYQFEMLVEKLNLQVKPGRNPIFDVAFVLQNMKMPQMSVKGLNFKPYMDDSKSSKADFTLMATEEGETISYVFEYCTKLFKPETIERLSKDFIKIIKIVTDNRQIKIKDIELLEKDEENKFASIIKNMGDVFNKLIDEDFGDI
ncbi:condensation domain-containing protein [Clostridium sp. BNL1100]|uniref:condensation domain-containing protein n=1 Tax=Clostridium sp. BNL1100 TaxID=755731 RepID=UPI00024A74BA|nr:condensation domain-containing protein [Clostridium sp. BNL1100]AEY65546.1 putative polyketide synthase component,beta-ketoacyl synthase family protein,phosphopantetheine-containing protein [Clostridium sp. BNL1100]